MSSRNPNDTDKAVDAYLSTIGVKFDAHYLYMDESDPKWVHNAWAVAFTSKLGVMRTPFKTGLGHRVDGVPAKPTAAGVLYCLLLDADSAGQSFANWCSDFGYDTDSRKALNTYLVCGDIARDLRKVFGREQLDHLRELLEQY